MYTTLAHISALAWRHTTYFTSRSTSWRRVVKLSARRQDLAIQLYSYIHVGHSFIQGEGDTEPLIGAKVQCAICPPDKIRCAQSRPNIYCRSISSVYSRPAFIRAKCLFEEIQFLHGFGGIHLVYIHFTTCTCTSGWPGVDYAAISHMCGQLRSAVYTE